MNIHLNSNLNYYWFIEIEIDSCFLFVLQVRKYLIPDSNDEIRQEQMREMELLTTAQTNAPNLSPNTSKNPLSVTNSDGQDDIGSDETGSNSSAQVRKNS